MAAVLNKLSTETWIVDTATRYIVGEKGVIDVDVAGVEGYGHGIYSSGGGPGRRYDIFGRVSTTVTNTTALFAQDDDSKIFVAQTGSLRGEDGININADNCTVLNEGRVRGSDMGLYCFDGAADITNAATGVIRGVVGIRINDGGGTIVNHGKILAESLAIYDISDAALTVTNSGRIQGDVLLGEGKDTFVNRGVMNGVVEGGLGNDTFRILSGNVTFEELIGQGTDTLQTKVSFTLADDVFIEILAAIGKGDIELFGNVINNQVIGNKGDDVLHGLGGEDVLYGGRGNDHLWGGTDDDVFGFQTGSGRDVIEDFDPGNDLINLEHYDGITSIADLKMFQKDEDVVIELTGNNRIVVRDVNGFNIDDFIF